MNEVKGRGDGETNEVTRIEGTVKGGSAKQRVNSAIARGRSGSDPSCPTAPFLDRLRDDSIYIQSNARPEQCQ